MSFSFSESVVVLFTLDFDRLIWRVRDGEKGYTESAEDMSLYLFRGYEPNQRERDPQYGLYENEGLMAVSLSYPIHSCHHHHTPFFRLGGLFLVGRVLRSSLAP